MRTVQRNISEELKERRKRECTVCKRNIKQLIEDSKRKMDEELKKQKK